MRCAGSNAQLPEGRMIQMDKSCGTRNPPSLDLGYATVVNDPVFTDLFFTSTCCGTLYALKTCDGTHSTVD